MSLKPLRECRKIGCHNLTRNTYCNEHLIAKNESEKHRQHYYDKHRRNKKSTTFYKSSAWINARAVSMAKHYGLCQDCKDKGILKAADMVHHIKPLKDYPELALVQSNLRPLCNKCHAQYK